MDGTKCNTLDILSKRDRSFAKLRAKIQKYQGENIALYGTGEHTKLLLEAVDFNGVNIIGLIDPDEFKYGNTLYGHRIVALEEIVNCISAIVISSDVYQEIIYERIKHFQHLEIIKLYSDDILDYLKLKDEDAADDDRKALKYNYCGEAQIVAFGITFRTLDNYLPVLDKFQKAGYSINLAVFPHMQDNNHRKIRNINYHIFVERYIDSVNSLKAIAFDELYEIVKKICIELKPKVLIIDDMVNYPSSGIKLAVELLDIKDKPLVICFQHGFFLDWVKYNSLFSSDYFFCFGENHKSKFDINKQQKVFSTGLPKIDRLQNVHKKNNHYILFANQDNLSMASQHGEVIDIYSLLLDLSKKLALPVKIKPHPQHDNIPESYREQFEIFDSQSDAVSVIAGATYVITSGSTIAIEALVLGKPTVILPSKSAVAYKDCPVVAKAYNVESLIEVLEEFDSNRHAINLYLDSVLSNWRKFNAAEEAFKLINNFVHSM